MKVGSVTPITPQYLIPISVEVGLKYFLYLIPMSSII